MDPLPVAAVKGRARGRARGRLRDPNSDASGTEDSGSRPGSLWSLASSSSAANSFSGNNFPGASFSVSDSFSAAPPSFQLPRDSSDASLPSSRPGSGFGHLVERGGGGGGGGGGAEASGENRGDRFGNDDLFQRGSLNIANRDSVLRHHPGSNPPPGFPAQPPPPQLPTPGPPPGFQSLPSRLHPPGLSSRASHPPPHPSLSYFSSKDDEDRSMISGSSTSLLNSSARSNQSSRRGSDDSLSLSVYDQSEGSYVANLRGRETAPTSSLNSLSWRDDFQSTNRPPITG